MNQSDDPCSKPTKPNLSTTSLIRLSLLSTNLEDWPMALNWAKSPITKMTFYKHITTLISFEGQSLIKFNMRHVHSLFLHYHICLISLPLYSHNIESLF